MGRLGFEPKTNRLKAECSTAELATLALYVKHSHLLYYTWRNFMAADWGMDLSLS